MTTPKPQPKTAPIARIWRFIVLLSIGPLKGLIGLVAGVAIVYAIVRLSRWCGDPDLRWLYETCIALMVCIVGLIVLLGAIAGCMALCLEIKSKWEESK